MNVPNFETSVAIKFRLKKGFLIFTEFQGL